MAENNGLVDVKAQKEGLVVRVLSGMQPSGKLHIGNFFGAMKQHLQLQAENEAFYFIADYHALTNNPNPTELKQNCLDITMDYLALGLDAEKTVFWRQSDVPEVAEFAWILSTVTPMGLLQRCTSYKDKLASGASPNHGLFAYPVLQAADILIFKSELVPVGADQKQHVEVTRDIAGYFNNIYKTDLLVKPKDYILDSVAVVPGVDGKKMSKSYKNTIEIFEDEKIVKKKIMKILTDSAGVNDPKNPETCNVFAMLKLFAAEDEQQSWQEKYRNGAMGYGEVKKRLAELVIAYFQPYREKRKQLEKDKQYVVSVLEQGAKRARTVAKESLKQLRDIVGLGSF